MKSLPQALKYFESQNSYIKISNFHPLSMASSPEQKVLMM